MALLPTLDIARSALLAQEIGLRVTGNNIANVNTPGYSRQRAELQSERPGETGGLLIGRGVRVTSVRQVVDPLLDRRLRDALTDRGGQAARRDQLTALSALTNDLVQPSLASALDGFFDAADGLARNPAGLAERETVLARARALTTEFGRRSAGIAGLQRGADDRILGLVREANDELTHIARLNLGIVAGEAGGQRANELRDERERTLTSLGEKLGLSVIEVPGGAVRVATEGGPVLVDGGSVTNRLATEAGAAGLDGRALHDVGIADGTGGIIPVPAAFARGSLGALADVRDDAYPAAQANLNTLANTLRTTVNGVQQNAAARDLDGLSTAAVPLFAGTSAADLSVAITDPRRIAAARSTQPGDNANALALADLRTAAQAALGGVTPSGYLAGEEARIGQAASQATDIAAAGEFVVDQVQAQRDAVSGVSLDEELTNLLRYQRAFQAAARLVNVADSVLNELVNLVR